jgi:hypothetical protein
MPRSKPSHRSICFSRAGCWVLPMRARFAMAHRRP